MADLVEEITRNPASSEEFVLEESFLDSSDWSEPTFPEQGRQRDLATATSTVTFEEADSFGELAEQREIPFTYPVTTRGWLEKHTLAEIEARDAKKQ